jgi:pimeloyl-ACP methyl ester carboxylesterase
MSSHFFQFQHSTLHYSKVGNGPRNLLMVHGFGQDNKSFQGLSAVLSKQYTAYVFDLYFHGQSHWGHGEEPLEKTHWKEIVGGFLQENKMENFSLAGYSLGGKFALATLEAFPERTDAVILLAPDGIKTSVWYTFATYPIIVRKIFKRMIRRPQLFQSIARFLHRCGLVDKGVLKFAEFQMNSEEKRNRVYYSWVVFRHLEVDLNRMAELINQYKIPLTVIVGQYDKVIEPRSMDRLLRKVNTYTFETPETGHTGLIAESGEYFRNLGALLR